MKVKFNLISIIWMLSTLFPFSIGAKNYEYNGYDIIFDRPEGELKYYDAATESYYKSKWNSDISPYTENHLIPFVFSDNGKVYVRNLFGDCAGYIDMCPTWMEGELIDGNIVFNLDIPYAFSFKAFGWMEEPLTLLRYGKLNRVDKTIEEIQNVRTITLVKTDSGYAFNFPEDEGYIANTSTVARIFTKFECSLSSVDYVNPPSDYVMEDYQINFKPVSYFAYKKDASLLLKVVRTSNEIFVQGLCALGSSDPESWVKGEIQGDKVVFKNGVSFGMSFRGQNMYLTPMSVSYDPSDTKSSPSTRVDGILNIVYLNATGEDLVFDYDPETGKLSNPSSALGLTSEPNASYQLQWGTENAEETLLPLNFFYEMELIKIPEDIVYEPVKPSSNVCVLNYIDKNGYMMDPEKLYIQLTENSEPYNFSFFDYNSFQYETKPYLPCWNTYFSNRYDFEGIGCFIYNNQYLFSTSGNQKSFLIYSESGEFPDTPSSGIQELDGDQFDYSKTKIFDLYGRRYETTNKLSPGIYIINGKKTVIK